ncbi:response regulator [Shewanella phaeophyticola]|uniref:Response regulator n=1 Tax=Shewanella phaeophyticola TaxID=2978345 RepID=A0ABT2P6W2_9GAMM|nr:response regulator [Shewanella sp. KJ10-1]MCT8987649.1 response regulator [Shewanella sp. KJ10-1]
MNIFSILIIDDNYDKVKSVGEIANKLKNCEVDSVNNTREALIKLKNTQYDLLVVDMNLPESIGEEPSIKSGSTLIHTLFTNERLNKPLFIIAATSHTDAFKENNEFLTTNGIPFVLTDNSTQDLPDLISKKIKYYHSLKEQIEIKFNENKSTSLNASEKVTLKWLFEHVDLKHWVAAISLLLASFGAGYQASKLTLVQEMIGSPTHLDSNNISEANIEKSQ